MLKIPSKWILLIIQATIQARSDPEIIQHPTDQYIVRNNVATLTCSAKNAVELKFRCNDDWFDGGAKVKVSYI